jgi:plasmid stability protein
MKNITLKVDDATYKRARIRAAKDGTSVSAMVRDYLNSLDGDINRTDQARVDALQSLFELAESQADYKAAPVEPLSREEIYNERIP